jgi:hypothetical protein
MKKITLNEELTRIQEMMGVTHTSPSGKVTNMSPKDDDYEINYGKNAIQELSPTDIVGSMREEETDENTEVKDKFKDQYGKEKGEEVYYATANKQDRDPETFEKNEAFDPRDSDGEGLSDCCAAPIVMGDICSDCGEHCGTEEEDDIDEESAIGGWDLAMEDTRVSSDNRIDYLENALTTVWGMGRGNNKIDLKSMAESLINDMFGEKEEEEDTDEIPGFKGTRDALDDLKLESLDELEKELEEEGSWMAMRAGKDGKVFEARGFQQENYFDTQAGALESAEEYAKHKGFVVNWESITPEHVAYEKTVQYHVELLKDGRPLKKMLQISLYRMPSGKYELTNYIM